ncbi:DUF4892 domain-containing protein [Marinobacterium nitratireducens]|uniref:DUF4892 domain-containing protein n=1 Tax=Marinobacterium nitratireducens TaxID=518897 RepID=UPI00166322DA|nr:DUF4892 domain-containing protein [Marinobacterium nitratireducens]
MRNKISWLLIGLLFSTGLLAQTDVSGSADYPLLERFPLSWIESYQRRQTPEYLLMLSELKKVNNVVVADRRQSLQGDLRRITYRIPEPHLPDDAFRHFREQIEKKDGEILFSCTGRDCGSSHYWANDFYGISQLYGLDRTQYYLAARLGNDYLALYAVQRGNRRVYLQLDVVSPEGADDLKQQLEVAGYATLSLEGRESVEVADRLVQLLAEFSPQDRFWFVVHWRGDDASEAIAASEAFGRELVDGVRQAGYENIESFGVGPLVPPVLSGRDRLLMVVRRTQE